MTVVTTKNSLIIFGAPNPHRLAQRLRRALSIVHLIRVGVGGRVVIGPTTGIDDSTLRDSIDAILASE